MEVKVKANKILVVDYPGIVNNEDAALKTLGGEENVTKVHNDPMKRLDMKWRPNDVFCKPTCADRKPTHTLLLKVEEKPGSDGQPGSDSQLKATIEGIAETVYKFESLCDFQYLPMNKNENGSGYTSFYNKIVPTRDKQLMSDWLKNEEDCPLFLPSPIFTRMDKPVEYAYKDKVSKKHASDSPSNSAITLDRAKRPHFSKFHSFKSGDVPEEPFPEAVARLKNKTGYQVDLVKIDALKKVFAERPLWTRTAIIDITQISVDLLKFCLPLVAYYWDTGPWRTMWCRYGYDPRKQPEAKIYQLIDFRLKGANFEAVNVKRSGTALYNLPSTVIRGGTSLTVPKIRHSDLGADPMAAKPKAKKERVWKFQEDVFPAQRQFFYQVLDIEVAEVQEMLHTNDSKEGQCTERDGWYPSGFADKVRQIMMKRVLDMFKKLEKEGKTGTAGNQINWEEGDDDPSFYTSPTTSKNRSNKGKTGPKHFAKSSAKKQQPQQDRITAPSSLHGDLCVSTSTSDSNSDDDLSDIGRTDRELRVRRSPAQAVVDDLKALGLSDEGEDFEEERREEEFLGLVDSDDDPDYEPVQE